MVYIKYYFTSRVVNVWNCLSIVLLSLQILQIVSKIDLTTFGRTRILSMIIKHSRNGTGNRSEVVCGSLF